MSVAATATFTSSPVQSVCCLPYESLRTYIFLQLEVVMDAAVPSAAVTFGHR